MFFVVGKYSPDHSCPDLLEGRCLDLDMSKSRVLGDATATDAGVATLSVSIPDTAPVRAYRRGYSAVRQALQATPPQVSSVADVAVCDAADILVDGELRGMLR